MATKAQRRHHRRRHTKPKRASSSEVIPSGPTSVHHIPDHLLELVLIRVGSSLNLLRAVFTCKRWHRIIADTSFLTWFCSLHHVPHVLGHYHIIDPSHSKLPPDGNNQVFVPNLSTSHALDSHGFSLDFLPDLDWELGDSRRGLLLLYRRNLTGHRRELHFPDMIVCDPLRRRYQGILCWEEMSSHWCLGMFLLDGETGSGCINMSSFRVLVVVYQNFFFENGQHAPGACVFSSGTDGGWQQIEPSSSVPVPDFSLISFTGRARSSLYWRMEHEGVVLALDETTMEFSLVTFPNTVLGMPHESSTFRVISRHDVDGAEVRVVRLTNNGDLKVFANLNESDQWVVEKLVRLPEATLGLPGCGETYFHGQAKIVAANMSYILVAPQEEENWIVSVDLQTLKVEWEHERNSYAGAAYQYELPWPPTLQTCHGAVRRRLRGIDMPLMF